MDGEAPSVTKKLFDFVHLVSIGGVMILLVVYADATISAKTTIGLKSYVRCTAPPGVYAIRTNYYAASVMLLKNQWKLSRLHARKNATCYMQALVLALMA